MRALVLGLALVCATASAACQDAEQRARAAGEAARADAAKACASDAGSAPDATGGDADGAAEAAQAEGWACARRACESPCAAFTAPAFHRACVSACTADTECRTDVDCGAGLLCVAVAPRVRRCRPRPNSHTP